MEAADAGMSLATKTRAEKTALRTAHGRCKKDNAFPEPGVLISSSNCLSSAREQVRAACHFDIWRDVAYNVKDKK
jgi:hypothetical protein